MINVKECNKILLYNSNDSELFCKSFGYTEKIMINFIKSYNF